VIGAICNLHGHRLIRLELTVARQVPMTMVNIVFNSFAFTRLAGIARRKVTHFATVALTFGGLLLAGCAGGITNTAQFSSGPQVHPDNIYVYTFGLDSAQVQLDSSGVVKKLTSEVGGASSAIEHGEAASEVREAAANAIVQKLQSMGLRAIRSDVPPPADQNVLIVQGSFVKVDEGNRRRRVVIGLGAGKSEIGASIQVLYKPAGGAPMVVQSFDASADSGKMPGIAETAGVGAAAGHAATSAAAGAGMKGRSEAKHATLAAVAKKLGDSIATEVAQMGVSQGWIAADRVK
jgi:Domain of unknown function (DUF4410)